MVSGWRRDRPARELDARYAPRLGWTTAFALLTVVVLVAGAFVFNRRTPPYVDPGARAATRLSADAAFVRQTRALETVLARTPIPPPTAAPARLAPMVRPGVGTRPLRVLVVGDSVGVSFANGLQQWAAQHGNVQVLDDARFWCSLGRKLPIIQGLTAHPAGSGCDWTQRWTDAVRTFDPDVTIVLFSIWEIADRQLPGRTDWLVPGQAPLDAWQLSEYRAAADTLSARGAPVVWLTVPCEPQMPNVPGSPLWTVDHRTIRALDASRPAVHVVDLDHALCAQGPMHSFGGVAVPRPDGAHFSPAGALAVSSWLMPIVLGRAANPSFVG